MKNIENYGVNEINRTEATLINGGGDSWLYKLGTAAHETWCGMVDNFNNYYVPTHIWGT